LNDNEKNNEKNRKLKIEDLLSKSTFN
jgi:hypothetical protein